jgi:broad specificity phosphatase PhoE
MARVTAKLPAMPRLFLIRHAEPDAGWGGAEADPGLSDLGRVQAEQAAASLRALGPLGAVSSPMRRCLETAAPYVDAASLTIEPGVSEVVAPAGVSDRQAWLQHNFPWRDGAVRRFWSELDPALRRWRDDVIAAIAGIEKDCAVFTHFIAINAIMSKVLGRNETVICRPKHASITEIVADGEGLRLIRMGAEMGQGEVR